MCVGSILYGYIIIRLFFPKTLRVTDEGWNSQKLVSSSKSPGKQSNLSNFPPIDVNHA